jgi:hypothetical protein
MDPRKQSYIEGDDPFKDLKVESWMILEDVSERQLCLVCKKSRKYFCYNCYIPVQDLQGHIPKVKVRIVTCYVIGISLCGNQSCVIRNARCFITVTY